MYGAIAKSFKTKEGSKFAVMMQYHGPSFLCMNFNLGKNKVVTHCGIALFALRVQELSGCTYLIINNPVGLDWLDNLIKFE